MKTMIDALLDSSSPTTASSASGPATAAAAAADTVTPSLGPSVNQYIFIFLKFIQSVVPTIEYDYTTDVRIGKE